MTPPPGDSWTSSCETPGAPAVPGVKVTPHPAETDTVSDDRPAPRLHQGTANLSQPWVFALLAAVHVGCVAVAPAFVAGSRLLLVVGADLLAAAAAGAALLHWVARRRLLTDPLIIAVLTVAAAAAGVRMVATSIPWAGVDAVLVMIGTATVRSRRGFDVTTLAGLLVWAGAAGIGWRVSGEAAWSWLTGWGMVAAVTGLVVVMRAGIVTLEQTLDEMRKAADEQAVLDGLTRAANRRGLEMLALPMIENARRQGQAVHCLYLDIDAFKRVNDAAGEGAGDQILIAVAEALKTSVRGTDAVARWSGDEFVVLGPGTGTSPLELERRLRNYLIAVAPVPEDVWSARVSIGSATLVPWDDGDLAELLSRAEQDMRLRRTLRRQSGERSTASTKPRQRPVAGRADD